MPAWITSLLRDEVSEPISSCCSRTMTSRPALAMACATARPTTPAPTTMTSISALIVTFGTLGGVRRAADGRRCPAESQYCPGAAPPRRKIFARQSGAAPIASLERLRLLPPGGIYHTRIDHGVTEHCMNKERTVGST